MQTNMAAIAVAGEESSPSSSSAALHDHHDDHACGFRCQICLDVADEEPIVTPCGHLFCWPCIHRWLSVCSSQCRTPHCPVCKADIKESSLIPIYGIVAESPHDHSVSVGPPTVPIPTGVDENANRPRPPTRPSSVRRIRNRPAVTMDPFRKVMRYVPAVLGGIGVVAVCGGAVWLSWEAVKEMTKIVRETNHDFAIALQSVMREYLEKELRSALLNILSP